MKKRKKQTKKCKNTSHQDQKAQELRDILMTRVPTRVLEIIASGKANDDDWMANRLRWVKSVSSDQLFAEGRAEEWLERMTEAFAVMSFLPGGTTSALGVKLFGLHFDAEKIAGRKVRTDKQDIHSGIIYMQEEPTYYPPDTYIGNLPKLDQHTFKENKACSFIRPIHPMELQKLPSDLPYPVPEGIEHVLVIKPATQEHIQGHIKPLDGAGRMLTMMISDTPDGDPIHACVFLDRNQATKLLECK